MNPSDYLVWLRPRYSTKYTDNQLLQFVTKYASSFALDHIESVLSESMYDDYDNHCQFIFDWSDFEKQMELTDKWAKRFHTYYFKNVVSNELIATAMHPCRVQAQMDQFDDIESYFEAIGC